MVEEFLTRTWEELVAQLIGAFLFRLITVAHSECGRSNSFATLASVKLGGKLPG